MLKVGKRYVYISRNYRYLTCHRHDIDIEKPISKVPIRYDIDNIDIGDIFDLSTHLYFRLHRLLRLMFVGLYTRRLLDACSKCKN